MSINRKVMAAGAAILVLCVSSVGAGVWVATRMSSELDDALKAATILRNHMHADMMHDALRGDVLYALLASRGSAGATIEKAKASLQEHIEQFEKSIASNRALVDDPAMTRAIADVGKQLESYIAAAREMVALAEKDADAAPKAMGGFVAQFEALEGAMKRAADQIEAAAEKQGEHAAQNARAALVLLLSILAGVLAIILGAIWMARSKFVRPIVDITDALDRLASGDLAVEPPHGQRKDEIGKMSKALHAFKSAISGLQSAEEAAEQRRLADEERARHDAERQRGETERERHAAMLARAAQEQTDAMNALADRLRALRDGDLASRLDAGFSAEYAQLRDDFNDAIEQLRDIIAAIRSSTREVSNASAEISASTTDLSQRTEEQAASLEETSASMEQIEATVKKNALNAQAANQSAEGARVVADRGGQVVAETVGAMARIEESSRKIADIIGVIDEIARQTNLLALNAAVEAARAGEAGRGFAVVASEVRSLAQRSSQAAKDIKDLILSSTGQVKEGVELVNRAGQSLSEIMGSIKSVASIVSDIASASAEQAIGIAEVNKALTQMDQATQQNSALVEENAATAKTLEQQAAAMDQRVSFFRVDASTAPARKAA